MRYLVSKFVLYTTCKKLSYLRCKILPLLLLEHTYKQVSTRDIMDDKNDVMVDKNQKGKQFVGFLYLEST